MFVAPSLDSFAFRATLQGHKANLLSGRSVNSPALTRAQAFTSVSSGRPSHLHHERTPSACTLRIGPACPRIGHGSRRARRRAPPEVRDEMRAFFAWRLHAGVLPVSNEADVGRHGAVGGEKDAPNAAPAPAEVTTAPVDEARRRLRASTSSTCARTRRFPTRNSSSTARPRPRARRLSSDPVDVRCELEATCSSGHALVGHGDERRHGRVGDGQRRVAMLPRGVRLAVVGEDGALSRAFRSL